MNMTQKEVERIEKNLIRANNAYYNGKKPIMSDSEFDKYMRILNDVEKTHPTWISKDSPLKVIGGQPDKHFRTVKHPYKMYSLKDVFSYTNVEEFVSKQNNESYSVEHKIDGTSLLVIYRDGRLVRAETRGDGVEGDDVTENAKQILDLPLNIDDKSYIVVHGEVYMTTDNFRRLQDYQAEHGLEPFANARNAVSGTLKSFDSDVVKQRKINFFAFYLENAMAKGFKTHSSSLDYLSRLGFNVVKSYVTDNPFVCIANIGKERDSLPYGIDGAVIKINSFDVQDNLGCTNKFPRWAIAFKYPSEVAETKLTSVDYKVGRTGVVTPIAQFEPVHLCGTVVRYATLNNKGFIHALNLHEDDILSVSKAGDIVPEIIDAKRSRLDAKRIEFIENCPSCDGKLKLVQAKMMCTNPHCFERSKMIYANFVSKNGIEVRGFGTSIIERLLANNLLNKEFDLINLFSITAEEFTRIDGIKERSANKLRLALTNAMSPELHKVIYSLGISAVGTVTANELAKRFKTFENFVNASYDDLTSVSGVGSDCALKIREYLTEEISEKNLEFLLGKNPAFDGEKAVYMNIKKVDTKATGSLDGLVFVITGSFDIPRANIEVKIKANGGRVMPQVNSKVDYLVAGEKSGKKVDKAISHGVPIISFNELLGMIK